MQNTELLKLTQYESTDIPSFLTDYNNDMVKIENAYKELTTADELNDTAVKAIEQRTENIEFVAHENAQDIANIESKNYDKQLEDLRTSIAITDDNVFNNKRSLDEDIANLSETIENNKSTINIAITDLSKTVESNKTDTNNAITEVNNAISELSKKHNEDITMVDGNLSTLNTNVSNSINGMSNKINNLDIKSSDVSNIIAFDADSNAVIYTGNMVTGKTYIISIVSDCVNLPDTSGMNTYIEGQYDVVVNGANSEPYVIGKTVIDVENNKNVTTLIINHAVNVNLTCYLRGFSGFTPVTHGFINPIARVRRIDLL